ncbi:MAG: Gfo/Idh/MocA family oxidoreductase, partial [Candidatus Firestonebacteria bacterium]|nr:Gfo/Idh/MocA family oxidoreductase [Candidatus Firestonebacteria bacterium]
KQEVGKRLHCRSTDYYPELLADADLVSVAVPTFAHHEVAKACLEKGLSVLLEKPMTRTLAEADELIALARAHGVVLQIGHIERFNEAVQAIKTLKGPFKFIEIHRLGPFSQRNMDIGVVLDLMIHDLDIVLDLAESPVVSVDAIGVNVLTEHEDIANVRLNLANGCVANITASRVTMEAKRKIRIFSPENYISIDYQKQELVIYSLKKNRDPEEQNLMRLIDREHRVFGKQEPLKLELSSFVQAVREKREPVVTAEQGRQALALALDICTQIRERGRQHL